MGHRIHAARVYHIEYGSGSFSWECGFINNLLNDYCGSLYYNGEYIDNADHLEVEKDDLRQAIEKIKAAPADVNDRIKEYSVEDCTADDVIQAMNNWLEEADPESDYVILAWF